MSDIFAEIMHMIMIQDVDAGPADNSHVVTTRAKLFCHATGVSQLINANEGIRLPEHHAGASSVGQNTPDSACHCLH